MKVLFYSLICLLFVACAQVVPLTGGDKDITPPKVIEETPLSGATKFGSNKIVIKFDEYIQLKDIFNQFIITPQQKEMPEIKANGKNIEIEFKEELKPSTTYKLNFGLSICDITEGNIYKDYSYTFSTGNSIDSLKIKGNIIDANTLQPQKDFVVMLYENTNDSVVFTTKPDYLSKTDAQGNFTLSNLPDKDYKLIAINDKNKNQLYDIGEQTAYFGKLIHAGDTNKIEMRSFIENSEKVFISKTEHLFPEKVVILFNTAPKSIESIEVKTQKGEDYTNFKSLVSLRKDSVFVYFPKPTEDTLYISVDYDKSKSDSVKIVFIPQETLLKQFDKKRWPLEIKKKDQAENLPCYTPKINLVSSFCIESINKEKLLIKENGIKLNSDKFKIIANPTDSIAVSIQLKEESTYEFVFDKGLVKDYYKRESDSIEFKFKTNSKSDYGNLKINLKNAKAGNYIMEVLNSSFKIVDRSYFEVSSSGNILLTFEHLLPDNYKLRMITDTNKDKVFSPGSYIKKTFPEDVILFYQQIKIIADWENEVTWEIK